MLEALQSIVDSISSFFDMVGHFWSMLPKVFSTLGVAISSFIGIFAFLPTWVYMLGMVGLLGAVLWIVIEVI